MKPSTPPEARAADARRQAMVEACRRLILEERMAAATLEDVAQLAGVTLSEVHRRFASREALLDAALASIKADLVGAPAAASSSAPRRAASPAGARARTRRQVDDERRLRTRRALLEAGKRLIGDRRIDGASIDTIVREAGVGKGSFFNHFASREILVHTVLATVRNELSEAIEARCHGVVDPVEKLARGLLVALRYRVEHGLGPRAILPIEPGTVDADSPGNASLRDDLQSCLDAGALRIASLDAALAVVLGVAELGLARLLDIPADTAFARELMHDLCVTMLAALGVDARRHDRIARDALNAVMALPLPG